MRKKPLFMVVLREMPGEVHQGSTSRAHGPMELLCLGSSARVVGKLELRSKFTDTTEATCLVSSRTRRGRRLRLPGPSHRGESPKLLQVVCPPEAAGKTVIDRHSDS